MLQPALVNAICVSFLKLTGAGASMFLTKTGTENDWPLIVAVSVASPFATGRATAPSTVTIAGFDDTNVATGVRSRT